MSCVSYVMPRTTSVMFGRSDCLYKMTARHKLDLCLSWVKV